MSSTSDLMSIGRFAQITGISVKALRFYDEQGLLQPAVVDPETAYRYYSLGQLDEAVTVRLLRDIDVPLSEIRHVLGTERQEIVGYLELHRQRLADRVLRLQQIMSRLDRYIDRERPPIPLDIRPVCVQPVKVISRRAKVRHPELDETIDDFIAELTDTLGKTNERPAPREIVLYHDLLRRREVIDFEVCLPIPPGEDVQDFWTLPGGTAAQTMHIGAWEDIWETYAGLLSWIVRNHLETDGPLREVYLRDDRDASESRRYLTELTWLVR